MIPPQSPSPVEWRDDGLPGSRLYGDVYFSSEDGLAETQAVFLAGCGLPDAWAGRRRFTVAELGFGTGLNIAALLTLWKQTRPAGARLAIFSVEAHPMGDADAARALGRWPGIAEAAAALLAAWPGPARGFHHLDLPAFDASLDLAVMDAADALAAWSGPADAWFLDGFAPAANPAMWSPELMAQVAGRSAPGARAATFTVAGAVRRGLAEAGFQVSKQPGFGRKRERLEAILPGRAADPPCPAVAILGAGIAGAALARALRRQGLEPTLFDPAGPAAGASGNAAALMTPRLDAGDGPPARLFAQAFRHAVTAYDATPGAVLARGASHLAAPRSEGGDRDTARFQRIAASPLHDPGALTAEAEALAIHDGLVLDPLAVVPAWAGPVDRRAVTGLQPTDGGWRLVGWAGETLAEADAVVLCAGPACAALAELPLRPVRGQCTVARGAAIPQAVSFGGYAIPAPSKEGEDGVLFGATHQRDRTDTEALEEDDQANLALIAARLPRLAADLAVRPLAGRAALRAATPDHLPLAGPVPDRPGLHVLSGFGGRGFCVASLLADHLAATLLGYPSPLPADLADAVDPARFRKRASRRTSPTGGR